MTKKTKIFYQNGIYMCDILADLGEYSLLQLHTLDSTTGNYRSKEYCVAWLARTDEVEKMMSVITTLKYDITENNCVVVGKVTWAQGSYIFDYKTAVEVLYEKFSGVSIEGKRHEQGCYYLEIYKALRDNQSIFPEGISDLDVAESYDFIKEIYTFMVDEGFYNSYVKYTEDMVSNMLNKLISPFEGADEDACKLFTAICDKYGVEHDFN